MSEENKKIKNRKQRRRTYPPTPRPTWPFGRPSPAEAIVVFLRQPGMVLRARHAAAVVVAAPHPRPASFSLHRRQENRPQHFPPLSVFSRAVRRHFRASTRT